MESVEWTLTAFVPLVSIFLSLLWVSPRILKICGFLRRFSTLEVKAWSDTTYLLSWQLIYTVLWVQGALPNLLLLLLEVLIVFLLLIIWYELREASDEAKLEEAVQLRYFVVDAVMLKVWERVWEAQQLKSLEAFQILAANMRSIVAKVDQQFMMRIEGSRKFREYTPKRAFVVQESLRIAREIHAECIKGLKWMDKRAGVSASLRKSTKLLADDIATLDGYHTYYRSFVHELQPIDIQVQEVPDSV